MKCLQDNREHSLCRKRQVLFPVVFSVMVFHAVFAAQDTVPPVPHDEPVSRQVAADLDNILQTWEVSRALAVYGDHKASRHSPDVDDETFRERFAGLSDPAMTVHCNALVKSYIRLYTSEKRKQFEIVAGLADFYLPRVRKVLEEAGLPEALQYLPVALSALNEGKVSAAGNAGLWQLNYAVAKKFGLRMDDNVDERFSYKLSTDAAIAYLRHLYSLYGNWDLAVAAFACGPAAVTRAVQRAGGPAELWHIYPYLPPDQRAFLPAWYAAAYTIKHLRQHKMDERQVDMPERTDTVRAGQELFLHQAGMVLNIPEGRLKALNRRYKRGIVPAGDAFVLPLAYRKRFNEFRDSIYAYRDSTMVHPDTVFAAAIQKQAPQEASPVVPAETEELFYRVKAGDNLGYIAAWYNVRVSDLKNWNNLPDDVIQAGDDLAIYVPKDKAAAYRDVDDLSFTDKQKRIGKTAPPKPPSEQPVPKENPAGAGGDYVLYTVKRGDTLWGIAQQHPGISGQDIMKFNSTGSSIRPGQVLKIPKK